MEKKDTVVMKFGGAAVATADQFLKIADIIQKKSAHSRLVVVVSAMGDTTDQLLALARQVHPSPPLREQDMLVSVGERISIALLAMALQLKGVEAISFTGSQSGIITTSAHSEARISDVKPLRLLRALEAGKVVIVAGFQGVSLDSEITTLGRGGSDTTAVALGVALKAGRVEFYKDVPGICSHDPKLHPEVKHFSHLSYKKALEIVEGGADVLHPRCVRLAEKHRLVLQVLSFFECGEGTVIYDNEPNLEVSDCVYES